MFRTDNYDDCVIVFKFMQVLAKTIEDVFYRSDVAILEIF